jgi:DNA-directed RNA polymerase subunit RPC12/RpoP
VAAIHVAYGATVKLAVIITQFVNGKYTGMIPLLNADVICHCEACGRSWAMSDQPEAVRAMLTYEPHRIACPNCGEEVCITSRPWSVREKREIRADEIPHQFVDELKLMHGERQGLDEWMSSRLPPLPEA